MVDIKNVL